MINNVLYVIILSAALDLVGPDVPKGVVLLADVIPSFVVKLCAPYFISLIPYSWRIILFSVLSACGMLLIASTPGYTDGGTIGTKLAGVVLASLSSGGGELSFLGLTHFYGPFSLAAWGSGTGGAGLVGAGAYALATTTLGLSVRESLFASSFLPIIMLISFFAILPRGPWKRHHTGLAKPKDYPPNSHDASDSSDPLLPDDTAAITTLTPPPQTTNWRADFIRNLRRARGLVLPYMLPLFLVYVAEYTINLGLFPVLLFPLRSTPFTTYRSFYPTYALLYQLGVFISRSSLPVFRIRRLYPPSFLQIINFFLLLFIAMSTLPWLDKIGVWITMGIIFWEGLLGGAVYVNTFAAVGDSRKGERGSGRWGR